MVRHIVMWKLKDHAEGADRASNAQKIKDLLEGLRGQIPGLLHIEIGIDFSATHQSADVVLFSEFVSRAALDAYHQHPAHVATKDFIGAVRESRTVADYEV
ncbi:Dabb family protein [Chitinivorax sp. B]|uniref:Dabb family protein n=1 Tax=Chitinivorax sp. B TaxID=2502235 RepID=UPI0010F65CF4|nr:Dabb family protein [Chitinivorax sp. B]